MQVFITSYSPIETARALDKRRLNKQIIECRQILNAIFGKTKAWTNPVAAYNIKKLLTNFKNLKKWI